MTVKAPDIITSQNTGNIPTIYFEDSEKFQIDLLMKGGGSENISQIYSLPNNSLNASRNIEGVKKFQDWLDKNKVGWATGFPGEVLNKASGYGRFGPRTTKAWTSYGQEYLKGETATVKTVVTPGEQGVEDVNNV